MLGVLSASCGNSVGNSLVDSNVDLFEIAGEDTSTYILNKNNRKIHLPECHSVEIMKESNKIYTSEALDQLIEEDFVPCKICKPH